MRVLIDGKECPCCNDVKVIWEGETLPVADIFHEDVSLCLTATAEGVILDLLQTATGQNGATASLLTEDLADLCR